MPQQVPKTVSFTRYRDIAYHVTIQWPKSRRIYDWNGFADFINPYKHGVLFIIAPAYSKVRYKGSTFRPFVCPFVRSSVRPSTIYVKVLTL